MPFPAYNHNAFHESDVSWVVATAQPLTGRVACTKDHYSQRTRPSITRWAHPVRTFPSRPSLSLSQLTQCLNCWRHRKRRRGLRSLLSIQSADVEQSPTYYASDEEIERSLTQETLLSSHSAGHIAQVRPPMIIRPLVLSDIPFRLTVRRYPPRGGQKKFVDMRS